MTTAFTAPSILPLHAISPVQNAHVQIHRPSKHLARRPTATRMVQEAAPSELKLKSVAAPAPAGPGILPSYEDALGEFYEFFAAMPGAWNSERTYHYLGPGAPSPREESQTTFDVERLTDTQIKAVLASNHSFLPEGNVVEGFRVSFLTRMESQNELVRSGTNLAFVPDGGTGTLILGSYYRDLGYEERAPVKSRFLFDAERMELRMTTYYTRVVSVDEIRLIHDGLRLRRIINYKRPEIGEELRDVLLVGYGVEKKGDEVRLVE